jgi:hypothetical protein
VDETKDLGRRAYHLLRFIVDEIGPRPAGGEGEMKFLEFAEGFFRDRGLATERQVVPNVPSPTGLLPLMVVGIVGLWAAAWYLPEAPWAPWAYVAVLSLLPRSVRHARARWGKGGATGYNLAATLPSAGPAERRLILCAHHDTARASRIPNPRVGEVARTLMRLWPFIALGLGAIGLARAVDVWAGPLAPGQVWTTLRWAMMAFLVPWGLFLLGYQGLARSRKFSPGANDNGSGVAVLMAAAEALAQEPLTRTQVDVVFFSAEESGLIGSAAYVKAHRDGLNGAAVVNLDMVGSGERLTYVSGAGLFPPRRTARRLNALLRKVRPEMRGRWYWMGNSDFSSFLAKGIPATSLEASGKGRENVYHTDRDTMDFIEPALLDEAARLVLDFAAAVDSASAEEWG